MAELLVFDPALCCSTGICGPDVDPELVRFAADLDWLKSQGVEVRRYNLAQDATAFAKHALVRETLQQEGTECLPLVLSGGEILSRGHHPSREDLASWSGVAAEPPRVFNEAVAELVAIGAAVAANSEFGFWEHLERAKQLDVSAEDVRKAVDTALAVQGLASRQLREAVDEALSSAPGSASASPPAGREAVSCCAPPVVTLGGFTNRPGSSGCC